MKEIVINKIKIILVGVLAGLFIGIGGALNIVFLSLDLPYLGALAFPIGLFFVCYLDVYLFTGKVGYIFYNNKCYKINVLFGILGNIIGAVLLGLIFNYVYPLNTSVFNPETFINAKIIDLFNFDLNKFFIFFIQSMMAGIFVYLAVEAFKKFENHFAKIAGIFAMIFAMVFLKAEHSVANLFYYGAFFNYLKCDVLSLIFSIVIAILGNSLGSLTICGIFRLAKKADCTK